MLLQVQVSLLNVRMVARLRIMTGMLRRRHPAVGVSLREAASHGRSCRALRLTF